MYAHQQKASEIATALIKISVYVRRTELRHRLEQLAFRLIEEVSRVDRAETEKSLDAIEGLMSLGRHIYEVEPMNAEIVLREIARLRVMISQPHTQATLPVGEVEAIFSTSNEVGSLSKKQTTASKIKSDVPSKRQALQEQAAIESPNDLLDDIAHSAIVSDEAIRRDNSAIEKKEARTSFSNGTSDDNQAIRQSSIFEKMRQFGDRKVQLKDVIAEFPGFSERTIRYDLQRLCSQGLLERVGQGGPGTYYRIRVV